MTLKRIIFLAGATALLVVCLVVCRLMGTEDFFYSLNYLSPAAPIDDSVVIVAVDASSIERLGAWPWPRSTLAAVFEKINTSGARVVAADMIFPARPSDSLGNDSLRRVFARIPRLVLPFKIESFDATASTLTPPPQLRRYRFMLADDTVHLRTASLFRANRIAMPDTTFLPQADFGGFLNISVHKSTQKMREIIHVMAVGDDYYPSFGLAAAAAFCGVVHEALWLEVGPVVRAGKKRIPLSDYAGSLFINFRGRPGSIPTISAASLLEPEFDAGRLDNRLVFVGVTEQGVVSDFVVTPAGTGFPGVEVWATAALDIIGGTWVRYGGGALGLLNWLLVLTLFPALAAVVPAKHRIVLISAATAGVILSVAVGVFLFKAFYYFWNPTGHALAWVFLLLWLAVQKIDPSLAGKATALSFESDDGALDIPPAPPTLEQQSGDPPADSECVKHATTTLRATLPVIGQEEAAQRVCSLCNGRIVRLLGSGGMAEVFLVWNPRLEVYRAVKIIKPNHPQRILSRFETEIRICSNLNHPNIVQSFSVGEWFGLPYLEMEFVNGASMEWGLRKLGRLLPQEVAAIGVLICRALQYAHRREITIYGVSYHGVIHRDLKPANIMISRGGRVKLADFGIARPTEVSLHTVDRETIIGTLPYLAPEQVGGKRITPRVDLYALGVTLYELITGERAFPQEDIGSLLAAKAEGKINPPAVWKTLPQALTFAISKAMANDPQLRYASAAKMGEDLLRAFCVCTNLQGHAVLQDLTRRLWDGTL